MATRPADDAGARGEGARHAALGRALLAECRHAEAEEALSAAIAAGERSRETELNLALARQGAGDRAGARVAMEALARRHPAWDEPPLRLAECLRAEGHLAQAESAYHQTLALAPARPEALIGLAALLLGRGEAAEARALLLRCCQRSPDRAEAWDALGLACTRLGDPAEARQAFAEALARAPAQLDYAVHLVDAAIAAGAGEAEAARLAALAADDPLNVVLLVALGLVRERLGDRAGAADVLEAAVALAPEAAAPLGLLGGILARAHRLRDAERILRRAAAADPDNPRIQNDLAAVLMRLYRHPEARRILADLLDRHGPAPNELCNLSTATLSVGLQDEAIAVARDAIALAPDALLPRRTFYNALLYRDGTTGRELLRAALDCAACLPQAFPVVWPNTRDPDRRLRVGLLSCALKTHPVGWLTVAGFEALDPARFELVCLGTQTTGDPMAQRFAAIAHAWHDTDLMDDAALAAFARAQALDVLIDLGGYGDTGRLAACAQQLAPVQIKWVGMQAHTTGLSAIDWFLTDTHETPPEFDTLYTERLLRLPDGYVCYSPPPHAPDVGQLPALEKRHVTFGAFHNLAKVTPAVIGAWARILNGSAGARLVLKSHPLADPETAARVRAAFAAAGVGDDRLELRGGSSHRVLLEQYNDIDIQLDTFPYCGGLTTCEALWMGVPTVTWAGESFASRHAASHLTNAGLPDWVAPDPAAYEALAITKARDLSALAALRAGLRARVKASPLCDAPRFGRNLAAALRHAWAAWCAEAAAP